MWLNNSIADGIIYISEENKHTDFKTWTSVLIAKLFTVAKTWKQSKCQLIDELDKEVVCVCVCVYILIHAYTMEC